MEAGFVGLGAMGSTMARNLAKANHGRLHHAVRRLGNPRGAAADLDAWRDIAIATDFS